MEYAPPDCGICLEALTENLTLIDCGHVYHSCCIYEAHFRSLTTCPLCRTKFDILKVINLKFQISSTPKSKIIPGLTEEETNNVYALQKALKTVIWEKDQANDSIVKLKATTEYQQQCLEKVERSLESSQQAIKGLQAEITMNEKEFQKQEYELIKYKTLYARAHEDKVVLERKLSQIEDLDKILKKFESRESIVAWANSAKSSLSLEEQAQQFYAAIIANSNSTQSLFQDREELKTSLNKAKKQSAEYKKALEKCKREVEMLRNTSFEEAPPLKV